MKAVTENDIKGQCLQCLRLLGFWAFRTNNVAVYDPRIKRYRKFSGEPGMADIYSLHNGVSYWIETKKPGGKQIDDQKAFQRNVENGGGVYLLIEDVKELIAALEKIE